MTDFSQMTNEQLLELANSVPKIGKLNIQPDYWAYVKDSADRHGIDPHFVLGVMAIESGGNPKAQSKKGATGLMQLMPDTAQMMGVKDIWNPQENIEGGTKLLGQLLKKHGGDPQRALWEYNAGGKSLASGKMSTETAAYIPEVLKAYQQAVKGAKLSLVNVAQEGMVDLSQLSDAELLALTNQGEQIKPQTIAPQSQIPTKPSLTLGKPAYELPTDPMSESLGQFQIPTAAMPQGVTPSLQAFLRIPPSSTGTGIGEGQTLEQSRKEFWDSARTGALSGIGGIAGSFVNPMVGRVGAGLGYTAGKAIERGRMPLPEEFLIDMGLGYGSQWLGDKVMGMLLPGVAKLGKIAPEMQQGVQWLGEKNIPIGREISESLWQRAKQNLSEVGLGSWMANKYRQRAIRSVSEVATEMAEKAGVATAGEAGTKLGNAFTSLVDHNLTYTGYQQALKTLPKDLTVEFPELISQIDKLGGIDKVKANYIGKAGAVFKNLLDDFIATGRMNTEQIDMFGKVARNGAKDKVMADKLKEAWFAGLERISTPGGENIGVLRKAADALTKEAHEFIEAFHQQSGLVYPASHELTKKKIWLTTKNPEKAIELMFEPRNLPALTMAKEQAIAMGRTDLWEAVEASYVKSIFEKFTPLVTSNQGAQYRMFQPGEFAKWFDKNGAHLAEIMPTQYPALQQWASISKATLPTFEKGLKDPNALAEMLKIGGGMAGVGVLGNLAIASQMGISLPTIVVANSFPVVATMSVMGPKIVTRALAKPTGIVAQQGAALLESTIQRRIENQPTGE